MSSPKKKINFDASERSSEGFGGGGGHPGGNGDNGATAGDSSPDRSLIKPVSLAAKFDYYSADDSDRE